MILRDTASRYGTVSKTWHWLIMALVISQICLAVAAFQTFANRPR